MELKQYFDLLLRWLWLIILGTLLGAVSAFVASRLQRPVYQATSTLLISPAPSGATNPDITALISNQNIAATYLQLIVSRPVLEEVVGRLGLDLTAADLARAVHVTLVSNTQLIKVSVEDENPQRATSIANALPDVFGEYNRAQQNSRYADTQFSLQKEISDAEGQIADLQQQISDLGSPATTQAQLQLERLQTQLDQARQSRTSLLQSFENLRLAEAQSSDNLVLVETAQLPDKPVRPKTLQNTGLAAVVGLMLAVGVAFLVEYLDDTLKTPDADRRAAGAAGRGRDRPPAAQGAGGRPDRQDRTALAHHRGLSRAAHQPAVRRRRPAAAAAAGHQRRARRGQVDRRRQPGHRAGPGRAARGRGRRRSAPAGPAQTSWAAQQLRPVGEPDPG